MKISIPVNADPTSFMYSLFNLLKLQLPYAFLYRQGIYCNNLANWETEIFEVDLTSMMVGRQFKPWAHSQKFVVVT